MAGETFKLNFITNGEGEFLIDEPTGFDSADFTLMQDDKKYGRDVSFSGGESEFTFYRNRNHYFDKLMYYYETFGWESQVELIIIKDGVENIIGDLDFFQAKTDQLEYFTCKVVQQSSQAIVKRRNDINVDVFSSENIDGDSIIPLTTENVLIKAKPINQSSRWETPESFIETLGAYGDTNTVNYVFNPSINLTSYEIDDTLTFFSKIKGYTTNANDYKIIEAQNNLKKIKINISNLDLGIVTDVDNGGDGYIDLKLELRFGTEYETAEKYVFFNDSLKDNETYTNLNEYNFEIPSLNRGDNIWLYFFAKVRQSATNILGEPRFEAFTTINSMDVIVSATSVSYNTVVPSIRLYDGVKQVVKSISDLDISFPFANVNGEMYNNRIFNGNMLRKILDKPFYISLKNIEDWLPEINGDYEIQSDGTIFFGLYNDFYKLNEIGVFEDVRFDDYTKYFNKRYAINEFSYNYKKFQSQKENEVENTFDVVHGESQWSVLNKFVENKKEVSIGFVRDSFYIDEQRRKSLDLNETTSTQDDDTIFIIDTKENLNDLIFEETDLLQHTFDSSQNYLKLSNTGSFSFILLGLAVDEEFKILGDDANAGTYNLIEVSDRYIVINNGGGSENNNGNRSTTFEYIVSPTTAKFISWSDEGFSYINNITNNENFANLKYTIKRNIIRFYNQYLATCNLFTNKSIKNTYYSNNKELELGYDGIETIEGNEFIPTSPILSPYMHNLTVITDFNTYKELENNLKENRGYIRTYDANGHVIKVYPSKMTFVNSAEFGELTIEGEEKYEKSLINITYADLGYVVINEEYRTRKIKYTNIDEKFYIFDEMNRLLYNPVYWQKISFNGATPTSKEELIEWLTLIS